MARVLELAACTAYNSNRTLVYFSVTQGRFASCFLFFWQIMKYINIFSAMT